MLCLCASVALCAQPKRALPCDDLENVDALAAAKCHFRAGRHDQAVVFYRKAGSVPRALSDLGWHHFKGLGVKQDSALAVDHWQRAAKAGDAEAALNLGLSYRDGTGVKQDQDHAMEWLKHAAGNTGAVGAHAAAALGGVLAGRGDHAESVKWFDEARKKKPNARWLDVFSSHDIDRDGSLRPKEVTAALHVFGNADFAKVDLDHDGKIEPNEFAQWFGGGNGPDQTSRGRWARHIEQKRDHSKLADQLDADSNGLVGREELAAYVKTRRGRHPKGTPLAAPIAHVDAKVVLDRADQNSDKQLSRAEIAHYQNTPDPVAHREFVGMDGNSDGKASLEEIKRHLGRKMYSAGAHHGGTEDLDERVHDAAQGTLNAMDVDKDGHVDANEIDDHHKWLPATFGQEEHEDHWGIRGPSYDESDDDHHDAGMFHWGHPLNDEL